MRPIFQKEQAKRPDPYLDWEVRTRPGRPESRPEGADAAPDDLWCSLYISVKPGNDPLANLKALAEAVRIGRLPEDNTAYPGPTIRMADDERAHLLALIEDGSKIQPNADKVLLQFFVYRLEVPDLPGGNYASTELYDAILAGPPIPDLTLASGNDKINPIEFDQLPGIDTEGVAIGVIDDGIAFAHERFCSDPVTSRVMAIWLQDVERAQNGPTDKKGRTDPGIAFGRRLNNKQINDLLTQHATEADIYRELELIDFGKNTYNPLALRATHGTHVLDVAAGYNPVNQSRRLRPILAVQLPSMATLDTSGVTMGSYVLQAVRQIMLWAEKLGPNVPLVINFSYGLLAGPKDGTHPLELALNELISYRNRSASTCLVVPAGNSYRARTTARMTLAKGQSRTLDWMILPDDATPNFLEIWLDTELEETRESPLEVTLAPPDGLPSDAARPERGTLSALKLNEKAIAATYYDISKKGRGRIFVAVNQTASTEGRVDCAPAGRWQLTLRNRSNRDVTAHLYIQRDSTPFGYRRLGRQSFFDDPEAYCRDDATGNYDGLAETCPITREETLSALATMPPGNGRRILVAGAAEASSGHMPASYTSSGPSATNERKGPDCSAVTEEGRAHWGVLAAGTFSGSIVKLRGTSAAAPQLVRLIADRFENDRTAGILPGAAAAQAGVSERVPNEAAMGVPDQDTFAAPEEEAARLGSFVIQRRPNRYVPRRRYPTESVSDPNVEITY